MKPISPNDERLGDERIPASVIDSFNKLIIEKWDGNRALITQKEVLECIISAQIGLGDIEITRQQIYDKGWMNIETPFRNAGWHVTYNKQCIGDTFESHYIFRKDK